MTMNQKTGFVMAVLLAALTLAAGCSTGDGEAPAATAPPVSGELSTTVLPGGVASTTVPPGGVASTTVPSGGGPPTTVPPGDGVPSPAAPSATTPSATGPSATTPSTTGPSASVPPTTPPPASSVEPVVWVSSEFFSGRFSFDGSEYEVELDPVRSAPAVDQEASYLEGDGRFVLELRDSQGEMLRRVRLSVGDEFLNSDGTLDGIFAGWVLNPPAYDSYAVFRESDEMVVVERSEHAPTAEITGVSEGQFFSHADTITLDLGGADADGDNLFYNVYYSVDPDAGFELLESDRANPVMSFRADELPGSDAARFGVSVSDGAQSVFVESPVFRVQQHAPQPRIDAPEGGFRFVGAQQVRLQVRVADLDGFPSGASVVWESDLDGVIKPFSEHRYGRYREISLETSNLSEGDHLLTVTAVDPTGLMGTHSVPMHILHESYVPRVFEVKPDFTSVRLGETTYVDVASNDIYERGFGYMELFEESLPLLGEAEVVQHPEFDIPLIKYTAYTQGEDRFEYTVCTPHDYCNTARVKITVEPAQPAGS